MFPADVRSISGPHICDGATRKPHIELRRLLLRIAVFSRELFLIERNDGFPRAAMPIGGSVHVTGVPIVCS
jgi:hypothetical protein